ncbi:MAG: molybdopterin-dependent oxidoreductase [Acidobacteriota bacterium]
MANRTRRDVLKTGLAVGAWSMVGLPEWTLPALAQGDEVVPFTDIPDNFVTNVSATNRFLDIRTIDGPFTPKDLWFTTQHYGHPAVDPAAFRLKVTGLVDKPLSLSLDDLRKLGSSEIWFGFECSGNSARRLQGLSSNARWTGVPLRAVLNAAGVKADGHEVVFFGADKGPEEVEFRTQKFSVEQQYGRSLTREQAMGPDPMLAWALNGEPLTVHQGAPLRLLVPGWYGVANVKWLANIHVQQERYLGKYQARWYRTLRGEMIDGELKWTERAVTRMNVKSAIARVTRRGSTATVHGFVLHDGTPLRSVEVKVDDGPWQPAALDPVTAKHKYSWKLFTYTWNNPTPGEHTLISRATDVNGVVQPTAQELEHKKTFLEDNSQMARKVRIG